MIDISFDFTTDSPNYWTNCWSNNKGLGGGNSDPDSAGRTLQSYHQILWSRQLPCGEMMELTCGEGSRYLTWGNFRFGSDSILASFRYQRNRELIDKVSRAVPDYKAFIEDYIHALFSFQDEFRFAL